MDLIKEHSLTVTNDSDNTRSKYSLKHFSFFFLYDLKFFSTHYAVGVLAVTELLSYELLVDCEHSLNLRLRAHYFKNDIFLHVILKYQRVFVEITA